MWSEPWGGSAATPSALLNVQKSQRPTLLVNLGPAHRQEGYGLANLVIVGLAKLTRKGEALSSGPCSSRSDNHYQLGQVDTEGYALPHVHPPFLFCGPLFIA